METSLQDGDSRLLSTLEDGAKCSRFCSRSKENAVAIRSNIVKAEPLPSITASAQYVMWHCVEEAGAQNTVQEVVGGGKIEPQKGSAWGMEETENKKRRYLKATELIFSL